MVACSPLDGVFSDVVSRLTTIGHNGGGVAAPRKYIAVAKNPAVPRFHTRNPSQMPEE